MSELLRVYLDPAEIARDGYPYAWRKPGWVELLEAGEELTGKPSAETVRALGGYDLPIKDLIREQAGFRCERCGHPYPPGITETCPRGEWTPCDEHCTHGGPVRAREAALGDDALWLIRDPGGVPVGATLTDYGPGGQQLRRWDVQAQWRILTTHHLNGIKHDCRWWNLAALCQRCHLVIQAKVHMQREYNREHSDWFKPHAAGFYAAHYLGVELTREETMARLDELLDLQLTQHPLPGFA